MPDAGRVIAGSARGIRLRAPGPGTRPLGDRVKETLFAILEPDLGDARVLDLYAGSGAAGIEALSRGASAAVFVERDPTALRTIERNVRAAGVAERATLVRADVLGWLASAAGPAFDVVLLDPPYADTGALERTLERLSAPGAGLLRPDARVVAKHFWRSAPPARIGLLASERSRRFGETGLTFYRRTASETGAAAAPDEPEEGDAAHKAHEEHEA